MSDSERGTAMQREVWANCSFLRNNVVVNDVLFGMCSLNLQRLKNLSPYLE